MTQILVGSEKNAVHGEFLEPRREVFVYFGSGENETFGAGTCKVPPLSSNEEHAHDDANEIIYVIEGEMRIEIDGEIRILKKGEAILVFIGQVHQIFNDSETEELWHTFTFSPPGPADTIRRGYGDAENFVLHSTGSSRA